MIFLTKGQPLVDNPGLVVCDPTGYYNDGDSIACAPYHMPDEPIYRYEAKFIAFGGMVYEITDEEKLLEEVKKLNPETLFGKNKEEVAIDKIVENIVKQESSEYVSNPVNEEPTVEEVVLPPTTEPVELPAVEIDNSSTTTPIITPVSEPILNLDTSTTTPAVVEVPLPDVVSTSTGALVDIDVNTTTPSTMPGSFPNASLTDH